MKKKYIAFLLAVCTVLSTVTGVCAAGGSEDYDALLEDIAEIIAEPWPSSEHMICQKLLDAFFFDVRAFVEALAFCDAADQQAVLDLFLKYGTETDLEAMYLVVERYYFSFFMESGTNVFSFPTKSEGALLQTWWFSLNYHWAAQPDSRGYETNYRKLFDNVNNAKEHGTEAAGEGCLRSLKGDPEPFVRAFALETEETQTAVLAAMKMLSSTALGAVIADILDEVAETASFSETEKATLEAIREIFEGIVRLQPAAGPDPEELAQRNARKEAESSQPTEIEPQPTETQPEPTHTEPPATGLKATDPKPTEPPEDDTPERQISGWVILPVILIAAAALAVPGIKRKKG